MHGENPFIVWGAALLEEPDATVDRILSGAGGRGSQQRAEPDDFLSDLLSNPVHQEIRAQLTDRLDGALRVWIETRSGWSSDRIVRYGPRAYAAQMADALAVTARLPLQATVGKLMREHVVWDDRFQALRRPGDIDLLREFDMVLALHQPDTRFVPRWFAACEEAAWGSPYWQTRLSIGLLGLRKLPSTGAVEPEVMQATALARFRALGLSRGMQSDLVERAFRQRAAAMTTLYPRHVEYWQRLWAEVLAGLRPPLNRDVAELSSWLGVALPTDDAAATDGTMRARSSGAALPDHERLDRLIQDIDETRDDPDLFGRVLALIRDHWRYAFASGESYYAVRTTTNLCNRILRSGVDESLVEKLHPWALQAVDAEPDNPYTWDLWAKVLSSLSQIDAALALRWESIRRFPENSVLRNSLAYLLAHQDRAAWTALAEHLLREIMEDFRDDPFCRNILANLLIRTEREGEAAHLLRETMQRLPDDTMSRYTLTSMLLRQGRRSEAEHVFADLQDMAPSAPHVQRLAERIGEQRQISAESAESEMNRIYRAGIRWDLDLRQANGAALQTSWPWHDESLSAYLSRLESRIRMLQRFFASSNHGAGEPSGAVAHGEYASELALVAAHRGGCFDGADRKNELNTWIEAHPSSYSVRLLLVWSGTESGRPDRAALSAIEREFPEHREWNEMLSRGVRAPDESCGLPTNGTNRGSDFGSDPWASRLVAVYPNLNKEEHDAPARFDSAAWKRLMEDIAFAGAERAVPSIAPSIAAS